MKKIIYYTIIILLSSFKVFSVAPMWAWQHNFNVKLSDIVYHNDYLYTCGKFSDSAFIFGNTNIANQGGSDVVVMKWDTSGNLIWATSISGSADEAAVSIKVNSADELIIVGHSNSSIISVAGNTLNSNGANDIFIAKFDLNGIYINAYNYGTAGNETSVDMCTDNGNNIYIASNTNITKYTNAGIFVWQRQLLANEIFYSPGDTTIVATGFFNNTLALGNLSINAAYSASWGTQLDVYATKISSNNIPIWLTNVSNNVRGDFSLRAGLNEQTGKVYIAYTTFTLSDELMIVREITSQGTISNQINVSLFGYSQKRCISISVHDTLLSLHVHNEGLSFYIYNTNNFQLIKNYAMSSNAIPPYIQCIRGDTTLFTQNGNLSDFGKIKGSLLVASPSYHTINICQGNTAGTLTSYISGGTGNLTYSWAPATGLNSINTIPVISSATSNITYTLTVTDQLGQIAKDTFNVNVQTPLPPITITSQYPSLCDSMLLYSNNGIPGSWYYYNNQMSYVQSTSINITQSGQYKYIVYNACGFVSDTIQIASIANVTGSVTDDTICNGQTVTFTGNGASNYTWSNGITDNVPFTITNNNLINYDIYRNYVVTGTDINGCIAKDTVSVLIHPNVSSFNNVSICANQLPYIWNGQSLNSAGTYIVNLINVNGCDSSATLTLYVSPCIVCVPNLNINYSPFYNSLTESQSWITTTGTVLINAEDTVKLDANSNSYVILNPGFKAEFGSVFIAQAYNGCTAGAPQLPQNAKLFNEDNLSSGIVLYPNPTTGMIHIQHDKSLQEVYIFDMVGKLIITKKCAGETETHIDLSAFPNGVYLFKASGHNSIKVIKNN